MSDFEHYVAGKEARRSKPGSAPTHPEGHRQETLARYLRAVAGASRSRAERQQAAAEEEPPAARQESASPASSPEARPTRVRDVMRVPATSVTGDTPFLDVARTLSRERLSAVPVVDSDDRVVGVVSESDLLAKAVVRTTTHAPRGRIGRLRDRRLYDKSRGETAAALMTYPAITVRPGAWVADAAWLAARSRLKRLPVTDHQDRLVGVVNRADLLRALVRSDEDILKEIESRIVRRGFLVDPASCEVKVDHGVVTVVGQLSPVLAGKVLDAILGVEDVVGVIDDVTRD